MSACTPQAVVVSQRWVQSFGISVRQLRERRGWSQERLAAQSELNRSYVGEVERGSAIASIVTAHKLARALGVDVAALIAHCEQVEQRRATQAINLASIAC